MYCKRSFYYSRREGRGGWRWLLLKDLLAKQAWKLVNEPDSLLARVYKGRYYASRDFLECGKGYRPSYAWRSIFHGRELLKRGLMKSIGDGTSTKVWLEKWVMDSHPRRPFNKQSLIDLELEVSSLLTPAKTWREDVIHELFPAADAKRIISLPVGGIKDKYIWAYLDTGAYSVKSGYWFAANHPLVSSLPPTPLRLSRNTLK